MSVEDSSMRRAWKVLDRKYGPGWTQRKRAGALERRIKNRIYAAKSRFWDLAAVIGPAIVMGFGIPIVTLLIRGNS